MSLVSGSFHSTMAELKAVTAWLTKPKIVTFWPFTEKVCLLCPRGTLFGVCEAGDVGVHAQSGRNFRAANKPDSPALEVGGRDSPPRVEKQKRPSIPEV